MELLLDILRQMPEYGHIRDTLGKGRCVGVSGVAQIARSHLIAALFRDLGRPMLVVCQDELAAKRTAQELFAFLGEQPPVLGGREFTFYDASAASRTWEQQRLRLRWEFAVEKTRLLLASWEGLSLRTMPCATLLDAAVTLRVGEVYSLDALTQALVQSGYERCTMVEGVGQFSVRGGILDVFSPAQSNPIRVEFFGDELDAMGTFDPLTQRRTENLEEAVILPVAETLPTLHAGGAAGLAADLRELIRRQQRRKFPNQALLATLRSDAEALETGGFFTAADRYMSLIYPQFTTAADDLPQDAVVVFCDHGNLRRAAEGWIEDLGLQLDSLLQAGLLAGELCDFTADWDGACRELSGHPALFLDPFLGAAYPENLQPELLTPIEARQLPCYGGNLDIAAEDLAHYRQNSYRSLVLCGSRMRGDALKEFLEERDVHVGMAFPAARLPAPGEVLLTEGSLSSGIEYPTLRIAILCEGQLLNVRKHKSSTSRKKENGRKKLRAFTDLSPGDLVVHEYHGIGRYLCMEQMKIDGAVKDYVKIAYQGTDVLYVPATQLDLISKYIGGGEDSPVRLNRLGGDLWAKTKSRAKAAVKDLAEQLIKLYAERKRCMGHAFAPDSPWQAEFENNFEFEETDDQLRCAEEIKHDMESIAPMDRLLCGDVGFGKTEVALRAAMKAILDGKQVAILVPTTVLAQQHYLTAANRFRGFPVNIDVLSRFRSPKQQEKTLRALEDGTVDLVIGTHKLLQSRIRFKDLGLLIVDEEQRFGVTHKERLKELSRGVDVLTLSATPIPRTLNMALSGIRDMSTIEEPPQDRYPVQTLVLEHNDEVIADAIRRELERHGQVYYLHNRVDSIGQCAARLKARFPEAEIAVAHGKMGEEALGEAMQRMSDGEIDILVCTTIIETGIDIANVNTLIIEDADRFGLAQLHQLRGRVGRANRHAFAYLTFRRGKVLSEIAEKRLEAIREFAAFGSGFKIALRDLEIRGAGNLLGAEQSGHMVSVGYDMYLKLLEEAVLEEQGLPPKPEVDCTADLNVTASIDRRYVENGEQRMDLYRRMAAIRTSEDADELLDEIVDRFGNPPKGVMILIDVALMRANAARLGCRDITQKGSELYFTFSEVSLEAVFALCAEASYKGVLFLQPRSETPVLRLQLAKNADPLAAAKKLFDAYGAAVQKLAPPPEDESATV